jgi:SAM-dependent methyltransferase
MLLAARDLGCEVLGVEPSERHSRTAREVFGLPVREGYFDAEAVLPDRFDLVILSHVIEHIFQPEAFLNVVMRVVIPGGLLVVVTPNADGSVARLTGRYWTMLKPMDHVSMLTPRAVRLMDLPEAAGLTIRQSEYVWEPLAGIVQALRDGVRERGDGAKPAAVINADAATARRHHLRRFLLAAGLLSAPLHAVNKVLAAQACLTIEIRKRAARGPGATAASRSSVPPGSRTPNAPPCLPV